MVMEVRRFDKNQAAPGTKNLPDKADCKITDLVEGKKKAKKGKGKKGKAAFYVEKEEEDFIQSPIKDPEDFAKENAEMDAFMAAALEESMEIPEGALEIDAENRKTHEKKDASLSDDEMEVLEDLAERLSGLQGGDSEFEYPTSSDEVEDSPIGSPPPGIEVKNSVLLFYFNILFIENH